MNVHNPTAPPAALAAFIRRARARAALWDAGELSLTRAVDVLHEVAVSTGLVAHLGEDAIQKIIADAFDRRRFPVHREPPRDAASVAPKPPVGAHVGVPNLLFGALHFIKHNDRGALQRLIAPLSAAQRAELHEQLKEKFAERVRHRPTEENCDD